MVTRPVQRMLHALSAWLQRRADWAASLAAQLEAPVANERNIGLQPEPIGPSPGSPPADWLARTQPQPPAHWLEHIRRALNRAAGRDPCPGTARTPSCIVRPASRWSQPARHCQG